MHNNIEKHKNQIQKRINQLQSKFYEFNPTPQGKTMKLQRKLADHNTGVGIIRNKQNMISKSMQVRNVARQKLNEKKRQTKIELKEKAPNIETNRLRKTHEPHNKQSIKQLYDMMKTIIQGQNHIQQQLNMIKGDQAKDTSNRLNTFEKQNITNISFQDRQDQSFFKERSKDKLNIIEARKSPATNVYQKQPQRQKSQGKSNKKPDPKKRAGSLRKNNYNREFNEALFKARNRDKKQRIVVNEKQKSDIWQQIESRIIESNKEYKDTIHRNNKHQHDHLINTYQLQKKLRDQLINKTYGMCNSLTYK